MILIATIVNNIQEILELINVLVRGFKSSRHVLLEGYNVAFHILGEIPIGEHCCWYNWPTVPKIATIVLD